MNNELGCPFGINFSLILGLYQTRIYGLKI